MSKKLLVAGLVIAALVAGAVALWVVPDAAQALGWGGGRGSSCDAETCAGPVDGTDAGYRGGRGMAGGGMRGWQNGGTMQGGAALGGTCGLCGDETVASGTLTEAEVSALTAALEDEHNAKALYEQAVADLGSVRPVVQLVRAEERHIAMLERQFTRYGLEIPAIDAGAEAVTFAALADACAAGVTAEEANAALYDGLLAQVDNADLTRVFTRLQSVTLNQHLPALEACTQ